MPGISASAGSRYFPMGIDIERHPVVRHSKRSHTAYEPKSMPRCGILLRRLSNAVGEDVIAEFAFEMC